MNTQLRRFSLNAIAPIVLFVLASALGVSRTAQSAPILRIDSTHRLFDSTKVRLGRTAYDTLRVTNSGTGTLTIDSVVISGATAGLYSVVHKPDTAIAAGRTDYIAVSFSPVTTGVFRDSLTIFSNGGTAGRTLTGIGVTPAISISTTSINIDTVRIGEQSCRPIDIQNTGTDTLAITSNRLTTASGQFYYYPLVGRDSLILPGRTATIGVCFIPSVSGRDTAYIAVKPAIPGDTATRYIRVTATGVRASTLSPSTLNISTAIVGQSTCTFDTLVTSGGTNGVVISNVRAIGADSLALTLTTPTLPDTLAADSNFVVGVCVNPTHRGPLSASIQVTFTTLGLQKTVVVPVNITAQLVCASASPLTLFSTRTLIGHTDTARLSVTNCGDIPTAYTLTLPSGTTNYRVIGGTLSNVVAPGSTTTFQVLYTPTSTAADSGTIVVNGGNGVTPMNVTVLGAGGTVVITARDTVPDVPKGVCQDFTVRVTNTGNMTWTSGSGQIIGPNSADFTLKNFTPISLAPDSSANITVTFCPKAVATETATLTFPVASPNVQTQITFIGRGIVNGVAESDPTTGLSISNAYPNPATASAVITIGVEHSQYFRVDLLDTRGAVVKTIHDGTLDAGTHAITIDLKSVASGHYYVALLAPGGKLLMKDLNVVH